MKLLGIALLVSGLLAVPTAAQDVGSVTLLEAPLRIIRGAALYQAGEGVRLRQGDIVETGDGGFAQLEFAGGGIVALGPASRIYILRHVAGKKSGGDGAGTELVLLSGWLKGQSNVDAGAYRYESPLLAASTGNGNLVFHSGGGECDVYVESGAAMLADVSPDGNLGKPAAGKAGQFFSRRAGKGLASDSRLSATFVKEMPQAFKDALPSRMAHFSGKPAEPKAQHAVSYAEIQAWLTMPRAWRRGFVARFETRLKDPEFRKQLEAHEAEYPEWGPALHPENANPETPHTGKLSPASALPAAADSESVHPRVGL